MNSSILLFNNETAGGHSVQAYLNVIVVDSVLIIPTVVGNLLVLLSLAFFSRLRKKNSHILVGNLALADLMVGLIILPMDIIIMTSVDVANDVTICTWFHCLSVTITGASVLAILLMSIERFHAIVYPFEHKRRFTKRRVVIGISFTWVFILLVGQIPHFLGHTENDESYKYMHCRSDAALPVLFIRIFNVVFGFTLFSSFGLFLIVVRTSLTFMKREIMTGKQGQARSKDMKIHFRHTQLMLVLSGMFIVCWGPHCIISILRPKGRQFHKMRCWFTTLGLINSALDWIVYGLMKRRFRLAFKCILRCNTSNSSASFAVMSQT